MSRVQVSVCSGVPSSSTPVTTTSSLILTKSRSSSPAAKSNRPRRSSASQYATSLSCTVSSVVDINKLLAQDRSSVLNSAVVLQSLHVLSINSRTALVKFDSLVQRLKHKRPNCAEWNKSNYMDVDNETVAKYLQALIEQNLVTKVGCDYFKPGPIPQIGWNEVVVTPAIRKSLETKLFDEEPYACPGCYWQLSDKNMIYSVEQLVTMLYESLYNADAEAPCGCPTKKGEKQCKRQGTVGTCPKSELCDKQVAKREGLLLVKQWLNEKQLSGPLEWARCLSSKSDPVKKTSLSRKVENAEETNVGTKQFPRTDFQICGKCLETSRFLGVTKMEGLCGREIALLIHRLMVKTESEEGVVHCLCRTCLDDPQSDIKVCRRTVAESSTAASSTVSRRVDSNISIIGEWVKRRKQRGSSICNTTNTIEEGTQQEEPKKESSSKAKKSSRFNKSSAANKVQKKLKLDRLRKPKSKLESKLKAAGTSKPDESIQGQ